MNEQAINDLYNLAKQNGYTKSLDEFVNLMYTNDNAFNDMYSLAKNNGYQKSQDDFSVLIGKKKSEAQPQPTAQAQPMAQKPQAPAAMASSSGAPSSASPSTEVIGEEFKGFDEEALKRMKASATEAPQMALMRHEKKAEKQRKEDRAQVLAEIETWKDYKEQPYFEGELGNTIRSIPFGLGGFIDDMGRAVGAGATQADLASPANSLMISGASSSPEQIKKYIEVQKVLDKYGPSEEMVAFTKAIEEDNGGAWGFIKGLIQNPSVVPEVMISSVRALLNPTSAAAAGTVVGGAAAGGSAFGGVGAGPAALASIPWAMSAAGATLETASSFAEFMNEELQKRGLELSEENVKTILEDENALSRMRNRALTRGATVTVFDGFTGRIAGRVGANLGKGAGMASKIKAGLASAGIEAVGGSAGEATARALAGQEMDIAEIGLEGVGEMPMATIDVAAEVLRSPRYKINGEVRSAEDVKNIINTASADELQKINFDIKNDRNGFNQQIQDKIVTNQVRNEIKDASPDIDDESLNQLTTLEMELRKVEGNKTQTGRDKANQIRSQIREVQQAAAEKKAAPSEAKPITYDQLSDEAKTMVEREVDLYQSNIDAAKENNREPDERDVSQLELLKSDPVAFLEEVVSTTTNEERKTLAEQALTKIKEEQNAIQVETAGQVPVQPTARPSEEVAQGEPQAEPQVTAQAGVEEEVSRLEEAFGGAFAETEQMLPASVDATVLEAVPTERKMELTFTQEDGTVSPLNGNEQMASDLYQEAVAIPKAQRTPAQQSVVDMVVSAQTQKPSGVSVSNKAQVAELETKTTDTNKKKIIKAATTAINTLKSIFPDMDIVIHESNDSYTKQVGQSTRGNFAVTRTADGKIVGGRIDINLSKANMRTVAHEVAHAVMLKAFGDNPALFKVFRDRITKILSDTNVKKLNDFASQYEENDSHEEFLVELSAALTEAQEQLKPTTIQKIAELINKVVSKITGGKVQPFSGIVQTNELIDFMNTMSSAIGRGEAIQVKEGATKGAAGVVSKAQVEGIVPKTRAEVEAALSRGDRVIGSLEMDDEPMDINSMEMVDRVDLNTMLIIPATTISKAQKAAPREGGDIIKDTKNYGKTKEGLTITQTSEGPFLSDSGNSNYGEMDDIRGKEVQGGISNFAIRNVWNTYKNIKFNGSVKVQNASDVAHIMRQLENKSVEHGFAVHVDEKGKAHIQFLGMGGVAGTVMDPMLILAGVKRYGSKQVYMVHNHPSGAMKPSDADIKITQQVRNLLSDIDVGVEHVILDTYRREYVHIDIYNYPSVFSRDVNKENNEKYLKSLKTEMLDEFDVLTKPFGNIKSSNDAAQFFTQMRFTALPKNGMLVLNRANDVIGNYILPNDFNYKDVTDNLVKGGIGQAVIFYSNQDNYEQIKNIKSKIENANIPVLDYIRVDSNSTSVNDFYKSYADEGLLRESQEKYGTNSVEAAIGEPTVATEVKEMGETFTVSKAQVDAYHGSPYDFDRFTTEKMGTGEGAQAFGWGLYFTDLKSIAETYAKTLAQAKSNSQSIAQYVYGTSYTREQSDEIMKMPVEEQVKMIESSYQEKIKRINKKEDSPFKKELLSTQDKLKERLISEANQVKPVVYQVSLHQGKTPDQYTWLEWDKPVSEKVRNAVKSYVLSESNKDRATQLAFMQAGVQFNYSSDGKKITKVYIPTDINGKDLYNLFIRTNFNKQYVDNTHKQASLDLLELGIDGVKYPAESIARGATSDTARGFNYVVFDENAVTIVSKAQKADQEVRKVVKDARAQGYSEAAIKAFLLKKGFTEQEADALMSKPEAGKKIELGEELMEGYDKMMAEIDGIIEKGLNRNAKQETILANVLKSVENSDAYKNGTDIQREQIVREVKQAFGEKMKSAPSVGKILGTIKDVKKVTMTEMSLLKKQLKDLARGAKDAKTAISNGTKAVTEMLNKMVKSGSISSAQLKTIIKKFGSLNVLNEKSLNRFIDYMTKVIADADYSSKLENAQSLRKAIKKLSRNKEKNASMRELAKRFVDIDPSLVDDIDAYNDIAQKIKESVKGSTIREGKITQAEMVNIEDSNEYISETMDAQRQKLFDEKAAEIQELLGVDVSDLSYEQLLEMVDKKEKITKYNEGLVRSAIIRMFGTYSSIIEQMFSTSKDPFTGEDIDIDPKKKELVQRFMDMDLNQLTAKQGLEAVDALTNFIQNGSTAKMEAVVSEYTGEKNAMELEEKGVKSESLKAYWSKGIGRFFGEQFMSLPVLLDRMFKGVKRASLFEKMSGLIDLRNNKSAADRKVTDIINDYVDKFYKEKANGEDFNTSYNATERGLVAFMTRNVVGTVKQMAEEFARRKALIEESIEVLSKGTNDEKAKAELYQKAYDKLLKDSKDGDEVRSKADKKNLEAIDYWKNKWAEIYDDLSDVSENVYNTLLDKDSNYTPDRFTRLDSAGERTPLENDQSMFHGNTNTIYKKKTGVLMEAERPKQLPRFEGKKKAGMYVDLSFDRNNANSMYDALVDINTAATIRQVEAFINSESFDSIIDNPKDAKLLKGRIQQFVRNMRDKNIVESDELSKMARSLNVMATIGVGQALGGVFQPFKQTIPVIVNTMINAGKINVSVPFTSAVNDFLNNSGYAIANRGLASSAEISSIEKLADLGESSLGEKALKKIEAANKKMLEILLVKADIAVARASWIAYYEKSLQEQGIDTKGIDYTTHELNKEAADYAQRMVDRQQNISDHDLAGKMFTSKAPMNQLFVKAVMPFSSFRINQWMRMTTDLSTLKSKTATKEDKRIAARSLAGFTAEMFTFKLISFGLIVLMGTLTKALMGHDEDEEEEKKRIANAKKGVLTGTVTDVFSPVPFADKAIQMGGAWLLDKVQSIMDIAEEEKVSIYGTQKSDIFTGLGSLGIAGERLYQMVELISLSTNGKFKDDYGNEKQVSEQDMEVLKAMIGLSVLSTVGLAPAEVNTIVRNSIKFAKKGGKTEKSIKAEQFSPPNGLTKEQFKRYFPEEYEEKYGEGSMYYKMTQPEREQKKKAEDEKQKLMDEYYDYEEKSKKGFGSKGFGEEKKKKEGFGSKGFGSKGFGE